MKLAVCLGCLFLFLYKMIRVGAQADKKAKELFSKWLEENEELL